MMAVCQISSRTIAPVRITCFTKVSQPKRGQKNQGVLARQARSALGWMLEAKDPALQRVYVFEAIRRRKGK